MQQLIPHKSIRNLVYAQVSFFICLAIALLAEGRALPAQYGISFYGAQWETALPYGLAFIASSGFLLRAAQQLIDSGMALRRRLGIVLRVLSGLLLFVLLTPDSLSPFFAWSHIVASFLLFLFEFAVAIWLTIWICPRATTRLLLLGMFAAGIVAMLSEFDVIYYLSLATIFFQLTFGVLLTWSASEVLHESAPLPQSKR